MCARLVTVKLAKLGLFRFIEECVKFRGNKTRERKFNAKYNINIVMKFSSASGILFRLCVLSIISYIFSILKLSK